VVGGATRGAEAAGTMVLMLQSLQSGQGGREPGGLVLVGIGVAPARVGRRRRREGIALGGRSRGFRTVLFIIYLYLFRSRDCLAAWLGILKKATYVMQTSFVCKLCKLPP
jgi:hypothetical protein